MNKITQAINTDKVTARPKRETRRERRRYLKAHKKYIKQLVKTVKNDGEFEWAYIPEVMLVMLKRRLEYYEKGDWVWQTDSTRLRAVETLKEAVKLLEYASEYEWSLCDVPEDFKWTVEAHNEWENKHQKAWDDAFLSISKNLRLWWD